MTPWTIACQALLSMRFSRQEYWSRLPFPSPGGLTNPGIKPKFPALAGGFFTKSPGKPLGVSVESLTLSYSYCFFVSLPISWLLEWRSVLSWVYPLYYCFSVSSIDNQITSSSPTIWIVPEKEILSLGDKWMTEALKWRRNDDKIKALSLVMSVSECHWDV